MNKCILVIVAALLSSAHMALAQSLGKIPRIGFLALENRPSGQVEAFRQGLRDLGYIEGRTIKIEYRAHEDRAQLSALASELVREKLMLSSRVAPQAEPPRR